MNQHMDILGRFWTNRRKMKGMNREPVTINKTGLMNHAIIYIIGIRYSQTIISCFQEDIGPIFKIFEIFKTNLHNFSVTDFSRNVKKMEFLNSEIYKNNTVLKHVFDCS